MGGPGSGMKALTAPLHYTADELELALNILAMEGGRPTRTAELLASQGVKIPPQTLSDWKTRWADRYHDICTNLQEQRAERMAARAEDVAIRAAELELELLDQLAAQKGQLKAAETAGAIRNVTTTKTLNVEKVINPLRNRPSHITEIRNSDEILRALEAKVGNSIETTAEDITTTDPPLRVSVGEPQS
jgi:hypothetical protein